MGNDNAPDEVGKSPTEPTEEQDLDKRPTQQNDTNKQENQPTENAWERFKQAWEAVPFHDQVMVGLEALSVVTLVFYSVFAGLQWKALGAANERTKDLIIEARRSADAATAAASAAKAGADAAAKQLERTDRPYISVEVVASGPVIVAGKPLASRYSGPLPGGGTQFNYAVVLANDGRSPTTSTAINAQILVTPTMDEVKKELGIECVIAEHRRRLSALIVRPSNPETQFFSFQIPDDALLKRPKIFPTLKEHFYMPVLVGCVAYKIPYSDETQRVQFVAEIRRNTPPPFFEFGVSVPEKEVVFDRRTVFAAEAH